MRYEGLTNSEIEYLKTPISDLTKETLIMAIAAKDRHCEVIQERNKSYIPPDKPSKSYYIGDDLGVQGILNHANGKFYDSKSKYYADLKASGHVVVESGMDKPRELQGDFDARKDVAKALNQLGY